MYMEDQCPRTHAAKLNMEKKSREGGLLTSYQDTLQTLVKKGSKVLVHRYIDNRTKRERAQEWIYVSVTNFSNIKREKHIH